ncbi:helix-turn-helix transcriptional regulator [Endozoicomonas sp.]|uniref:helix-turn-helix transcriptional regulator n=1 Tax=Endozoicomonas sp. TaxID=1892382 RepID=UPI0028873080|nr:DNA-binding protein [Endozoicomonas sp.]
MTIRHLSSRDLATRWGLKPRTLERWRSTGCGPRFLRLGGRVAYRLEDVESYEQSHYYHSTSQPAELCMGGQV